MKIDKKGTITHNLKSLWKLLSQKERKNLLYFLLLILSQVLFETLSIGSLYPLFVNLFSSETKFNEDSWVNLEIFENFIGSESVFFNLSIIIIIIFLLKNLFLIFVVHWTQSFERDFKLRLKKIAQCIFVKIIYFNNNLERKIGKKYKYSNRYCNDVFKSGNDFFSQIYLCCLA